MTTEVADAVRAARDRIDALAAPDGNFAVVCRESGVRPAPVSGRAFDSYEDAEHALDATRSYRTAMRRLDPGLAEHDLVVCRLDDAPVEVTSVRESTPGRRANGLPRASRTATVTGTRRDEWLRVENAPLVHLSGGDEPLDDEFVARQIEAKLG